VRLTDWDQSGGIDIGHHPHWHVDQHFLGVLLLGLVVAGCARGRLGVVPLLGKDHRRTGYVGPLGLGDALTVRSAQVLKQDRATGLLGLLGAENGQTLTAQPLDLGGVLGCLGGLVAKPLGLVLQRVAVPALALQAGGGCVVLLDYVDRPVVSRGASYGVATSAGAVQQRAAADQVAGSLRGESCVE